MMEKLDDGTFFYFPKINRKDLKDRFEMEISKANKRLTFIELYESRFYLH